MTLGVESPQRPLLRYHGGKWRLAPPLLDQFPQHKIYTEAFGGGASLLLRKPRSYGEIYNDLDGEIVNLFRVVRDCPAELRRRVEFTPYARDEFDLSHLEAIDNVERARRTLVRAAMGFGGCLTRPNRDGTPQRTGFRSDANRSGSTPARDWAGMSAVIDAVAKRIAGVVIENSPAAEVLMRHDSEQTLHYVDPPYVHSTRTASCGGSHRAYRFEMLDEDHEQLSDVLHGLGGMVLLSGYHSALYDRLYADWERVEISAHADGAKDRVEVLWSNPAAARARRACLLL